MLTILPPLKVRLDALRNLFVVPIDIFLPGSPTTTTQPPLDNSTKIATTAYVDSAIIAASDDNIDAFLLMGG